MVTLVLVGVGGGEVDDGPVEDIRAAQVGRDRDPVAAPSVGPRERVVLLRIGEAQVLVGVGPGGIVPLTPLAAPITLQALKSTPAFAERLRDMMKRHGGTP